jgi:large repetitive protein
MKGVVFFPKVRRLIAPTALIAVLAVFVGASSVQAGSGGVTAVSCGQTLKASVRLADDLVDCPGNGLIIGAANITVDLNGHTIDGAGSKKPGSGISNGNCSEGAAPVCTGFGNVTVENGTITDFYFAGVNAVGSRSLVVRKLTVRKIGGGCTQGDLCAGIFLLQSTGTTITASEVSNQVQAFQVNGIDVHASPSTRVEGSRVDRNAGNGIVVFESPRSRFVGNQLDENRQVGLHVNNSSDSTQVIGNDARGNRSFGIAVGAIRNGLIVRNSVSGNGEVGLLLFDLSDSVARGNRASGNANGIVLYGGQAGVAAFGGRHGSRRNQLVGNSAIKNTRAGIVVRGDGGKEVADDNVLSGNVASRNGRAGGIVIEGSSTRNKLRANRANANAGHGIVAVRGTIDAGSNRARGNRVPPQCVGVACS